MIMSDGEDMWVDKHGEHIIRLGDGGGEEMIIVKELENSNFEGDTTIAIEGGEIKITKKGDEMSAVGDGRCRSKAVVPLFRFVGKRCACRALPGNVSVIAIDR